MWRTVGNADTSFLFLNISCTIFGLNRAENDIHLLETLAFSLRQQSIRTHDSESGGRGLNLGDSRRENGHEADVDGSKHDENFVPKGSDHLWRDFRHDKVYKMMMSEGEQGNITNQTY